MSSPPLPSLTAAQTAARLGIKPETLYAYVSRGLLRRDKGRDGSRFDALEVEAFARSRRGGTPSTMPTGHSPGSPLMTIEHDITLLEDDRLYLRGREITALCTEAGFETVCWWLWTRRWEPDRRFGPPTGTAPAAGCRAALPEGMALREQMHVLVTVLGATDPLRHDLSSESVARMGADIIGGVVASLPPHGRQDRRGSLAARLWPRLSDRPADPTTIGLVDTALTLLIDHDLAASTLAVRAAASARANPYAVVSCGLGALDSALHGNAGRAAYVMIGEALRGSADHAVASAVVAHGGVPGFGHRVYSHSDPRWEHLITRLRTAAPEAAALRAADAVVSIVRDRIDSFPNVDLALATLAHVTGLDPGATELIFALARCGGWIAHAQAEYAEPPLRLRPEGRYTGP
ncbi:MAG TPA: citrate synthase [Microlunatus sp.]|nr:citrate synthase [Microlunatus sp.]